MDISMKDCVSISDGNLQGGHQVGLQGEPQGVLHGVVSFQMDSGRGNIGRRNGQGCFQLKFKVNT